MEHNWRIFISYRGGTEGMAFAKRLYEYLREDPLYESVYGDVYFSEESAELGHDFIKDIPDIMKNVKYFVMPLTQGYFDDFWDEANDKPDSYSVTYHEIVEALKVGCRFIRIVFPGFKRDRDFLRKVFGNEFTAIDQSVIRDYTPESENDIMAQISNTIIKKDHDVRGMSDIYSGITPNVFLSKKRETEDTKMFPFYELLFDVHKITLLNYAASTFITGMDVASIYNETDRLKHWFAYHLKKGDIEADVILTDPHSTAANDAALYKMYPDGIVLDKDDIILHNLNKLFEFKKNNPNARINVYLTGIALPYGVLMTRHKDNENNYIKVDLYSAVINNDSNRPSMYLLESNPETRDMYDFFADNVRNIRNNYSVRIDEHLDISFLLDSDKHIIHRGVINNELRPHTKGAYEECIRLGFPMEVDLLRLKDGTILVARDDYDISEYGFNCKLSELKKSDINRLNRKAKDTDRLYTFEDFLDLVAGKVPLLIEIKTIEKELTDDIKDYVGSIVSALREYSKRYASSLQMKYGPEGIGFAIHCANPKILSEVKKMDCLIPCGVITKDFEDIKDIVGEEFYEWHKNASYTDIVSPDFISCDVNYLGNENLVKLISEQEIPLLAWPVKNAEDQETAEDYECNNIIIDGSTNYLI